MLKNNKETKQPILSTPVRNSEIQDKIKKLPETIEGGLGSVVVDNLVESKKKELLKKVEDIGVSAYNEIESSTELFHAINKGDVVRHIPLSEDSLETKEEVSFSKERALLRPEMAKAVNSLIEANEKAFLDNTEAAWDALSNTIKNTKKIAEKVKNHLKNAKK